VSRSQVTATNIATAPPRSSISNMRGKICVFWGRAENTEYEGVIAVYLHKMTHKKCHDPVQTMNVVDDANKNDMYVQIDRSLSDWKPSPF
jgi:hypothetical protein